MRQQTAKTKTGPRGRGSAREAAGEGHAQDAAGSVTETVYQRLKGMILNNELAPGYTALEQELGERLGVSRTPVRAAMQRLQDEGLVETRPRHGMRVKPMSPEDVREVHELTCCLEVMAAEKLASRGLKAGSPEIVELQQATDDMEACLERDDLDGWAAADRRFHRAILEHCGNKRLARIGRSVSEQCQRVRMVTLRLRKDLHNSAFDHKAVVEAILRHDPRLACEVHRAHRMRTMEEILEILDHYKLNSV